MDEVMKNMSEEFSIEEVENVEALSEESMWYVIGAGTFVMVGICACQEGNYMKKNEMLNMVYSQFDVAEIENIEALDGWDNAKAFLEGGLTASGVLLAALAL